MPDWTSRFSLPERGEKLLHYMGTSTFSSYTVLPELAVAKIREELRRTIRQVQRELHITTVMVTHDQEEAFAMADRTPQFSSSRAWSQRAFSNGMGLLFM